MPSFFYQRNMIDPSVVPPQERAHNIKFQDAEIHAIVSYLFDKSTHRVWQQPGAGDAGRGKQIVNSVGCMGCHIDTEQVKDEKSGQIRLAKREDFPLERNYGFNLTGVGHEDESAPGFTTGSRIRRRITPRRRCRRCGSPIRKRRTSPRFC